MGPIKSFKQRYLRSHARRTRASIVAEAVAGVLILVPLALLSVDAMAMVTASHSTEELAQTAARAAANTTEDDIALKLATDTVDLYPRSDLVVGASINTFHFDKENKVVTVEVVMQVRPPVPLPGVSLVDLKATSAQPIVALRPAV